MKINWKVVAVEPNRYLVWESTSGRDSMVMALYPLDASHTRLVWRIHNHGRPGACEAAALG